MFSPDSGVVAELRQQIGDPAVDRRADLRALEIYPSLVEIGQSLLILGLGGDRVARVGLFLFGGDREVGQLLPAPASLSAFCALAWACCTAASARPTAIL